MSEAMITRRGGGGSSRLQSKSVSITEAPTNVVPDSGYDGMSTVTVDIAAESQIAATSYTPGTQAQTIAANKWLAGAQTIQGDANLLAANIKKGISIFGVAGSYEAAALDTNSAVLKVVTSTGCSVSATNGTDTFTQQDADGFVRPNDANVTEHFFVIPATAFGTFTVTSTHPTYGDNIKANAVVIGSAGKVYEVLCGGKNIILDGTFGLQDGLILNTPWVYSDRTKEITAYSSSSIGAYLFYPERYPIPVTAYSELKITAAGFGATDHRIKLIDEDGELLCNLEFPNSLIGTSTGQITNKHYPTAGLKSWCSTIKEIVLA